MTSTTNACPAVPQLYAARAQAEIRANQGHQAITDVTTALELEREPAPAAEAALAASALGVAPALDIFTLLHMRATARETIFDLRVRIWELSNCCAQCSRALPSWPHLHLASPPPWSPVRCTDAPPPPILLLSDMRRAPWKT